MIIRVDALENLVADTAQYLGKEKEELLQDIQGVNFRMGDASGYKYISDNKKEQIDEVYLCHVARKLDTDHNMKLLPLKKVLTTENAFSDFLKNHGISFEVKRQREVELLYHGAAVAWQDKKNGLFNPARFQSRLYKDFCINGFQFMYDVIYTAGPDFNLYSFAPEFLQDLDHLLDAGLVNDFREISHTFVALCRIPMGKIVFDHNPDDGRFEERYIYSALGYIWEYYFSNVKRGQNCMLRGLDDYTVQVERWIPETEIEHCHHPY